MSNCVDCKSPPGGKACCPEGMMPICIVSDGKPKTNCLKMKQTPKDGTDPFQAAIFNEIRRSVGQQYADDARQFMTIENGLAEYQSSNGRVFVTARNPKIK